MDAGVWPLRYDRTRWATLIRQIQEAAAQGKEILIVSAKKNGTRANANREKMLRELTGIESLSVISGFVNFANFIEMAAGECL